MPYESNTEKSIFISHSFHDKDYAEILLDLLRQIGVNADCIFCSSVSGYGVPTGENIIDALSQKLCNNDIIIFLLSDNYFNSAYCLNEMGAAWVRFDQTCKIPILVPHFDLSALSRKGSVIGTHNLCLNLNEAESITKLYSKIKNLFNINDNWINNWERIKAEFLDKVNLLSLTNRKDYLLREYYTFSGLSLSNTDYEEKERLLFQNFEIKRDKGINYNAVSYLWADTYNGSTINAAILTETGKSFLRVNFDNKGNFSGNIMIRPYNDLVLQKRPECKYLSIEVRNPGNDTTLSQIGISVRIVDAFLQHMEYTTKRKDYIPLKVSNREWDTLIIDLSSDIYWTKFASDGNHKNGPNKPCFDIITSVALEFGSFTEGRPGKGTGSIDIGKIELRANE